MAKELHSIMDNESNANNVLARTPSDRVGVIAAAVVLWAIAAWMFWIVEKFADGRTWFDFGVKLVLHDLTFAIFIFGFALVFHAIYPSSTQRLLSKTGAKLSYILSAIILLFAISLAFISLVLPVLLHFELIK